MTRNVCQWDRGAGVGVGANIHVGLRIALTKLILNLLISILMIFKLHVRKNQADLCQLYPKTSLRDTKYQLHSIPFRLSFPFLLSFTCTDMIYCFRVFTVMA